MAYHNPYISGSFIAKAFFVAHVYGSLKFPFGRLDDFFSNRLRPLFMGFLFG